MDYRTWCLLLAAVASTLATVRSASLEDATQLKDLRLNGTLLALAPDAPNDDAQKVDKDDGTIMTFKHHKKCQTWTNGTITCSIEESSTEAKLKLSPGGIASVVIGIGTFIVCLCAIVCYLRR